MHPTAKIDRAPPYFKNSEHSSGSILVSKNDLKLYHLPNPNCKHVS